MRYRLKSFFKRFKLLPENKLKGEYIEMLQKLKRLENQVESNAQQLELAKTSFLKNLYHEIRTPLNAIMGFTNILAKEEEISAAEREEFLALINNSSAEFLRVMDDIIQASLLEAGMVKINKDEFELNSFLEELHVYFSTRKHVLNKTEIALLKNLPTSTNPISLVCDKHRLTQILSQLIENALKFTERGIVEYGYCIKGQKLEFYVKDSGEGHLDGKENYIFSRFSKIDVSDDSKNGLGLGLSISKKLVELMNGNIWYTANEGRGTCFYFTVPLVCAGSKVISKNTKGNLLENMFKGQSTHAV